MVSLSRQIVQPGKEWDERERRGGVGAISVVERSEPRKRTEELRGVSISQSYLNEITTEMDPEWLSCRNYKSWLSNRSTGSAASTIESSQDIRALCERVQELSESNSALSERVQELSESNSALSERVQELSESNSALQSRISALEEQLLKKATLDNLWEISDKNIKALKEISGFTQIQDKSVEKNPFNRLKGLLKEYSDDTVDSVELVNSVRGK